MRPLLAEAQRGLLREATGNTLSEVMKLLRLNCPDAFHTKQTLGERRFFDQPLREEPCARSVGSSPLVRQRSARHERS